MLLLAQIRTKPGDRTMFVWQTQHAGNQLGFTFSAKVVFHEFLTQWNSIYYVLSFVTVVLTALKLI